MEKTTVFNLSDRVASIFASVGTSSLPTKKILAFTKTVARPGSPALGYWWHKSQSSLPAPTPRYRF
jgi:hypothetical protein